MSPANGSGPRPPASTVKRNPCHEPARLAWKEGAVACRPGVSAEERTRPERNAAASSRCPGSSTGASRRRNKEAMILRGRQAKPEDAVALEETIRDPYLLEFLNLKDEYSEAELEDAIIQHLHGADFC